jgi:hypothetical protein
MIAAGIALVVLPFIAFTIVGIRDMGWKQTAAMWGFSLFVTAVILCGAFLIEAGARA